MPCRSIALLLVVVSAFAALPAAARPSAAVAVARPVDCDAQPSRILRPPPAHAPAARAAAAWLDDQRLRWPGQRVAPGQRWRLYHSALGRIAIEAGRPVRGADGVATLRVDRRPLTSAQVARFRWLGDGVQLALSPGDRPRLGSWLRGQVVLVREDLDGRVVAHTGVQLAGALDARYARAALKADDLGVTPGAGRTVFALWAPTARSVRLCLYRDAAAPARAAVPMQRDPASGVWRAAEPRDLSGQSYAFLVDVFVPGHGLVRNRVTDPYSVSLSADSARSWIGRLDDPRWAPEGWASHRAPDRVRHPTDAVIYELHLRDFSIGDAGVRPAWRGTYRAFEEAGSDGMKHLRALSQAGLTDVHLLPVFDIASVPERGCVTPAVSGPPDGREQQAAVAAVKDRDCFNWGYDPWHFNAPEGGYATDPADGAVRIREFRRMVMALHGIGLRVGMDVVYNHTSAAGQDPKSVLDRIVPGYYHRLDGQGRIERSTCCDNTATEHAMMGKLMSDSVLLWARHYGIDAFRFDLMGHQPKQAMVEMHQRLRRELGRDVHFIGEGWNFGEVADGARFVQASQRELGGTGIGSFSDRARDAVRGGGAGESGPALVLNQGYVNGLVTEPNERSRGVHTAADLMRAADLVRVGLAGTLRGYRMTTADGREQRLEQIAYGGGQPAGYALQPAEVVNYVENHDNLTLFDNNVFKLPLSTSTADRARVQMLAAAINVFSQGIAYFHAGIDTLRSKSLDRNSYDSGDWFNRIDWTYRDNHFGAGLPPSWDNESSWPVMQPLLAQADRIRPTPADIAFARDQFRDLLAIRASTTLLRLRTAEDVMQRLVLHNTGPSQQPAVLVGEVDGAGYPGAGFRRLAYFVNVDKQAHTLTIDAMKGRAWVLHPVHRAGAAADGRAARESAVDVAAGRFTVPARTAVVWVVAE